MASTQPAAPRTRLLRVALPAAALAYATIAVLRFPPSEPLLTTYGAASSAASRLGILAGLSLLAAGAWAVWQPAARRTGVLVTTAGALWFAPDWVGWEDGPPVLRSLAAAAAPLLPVVLLHLVAGLLGDRLLWRAALVGYALVAGLGVATVVLVDPFLDAHCWRNCTDNPLLLWSVPDAATLLGRAAAATWAAAGAVVAAAAAWRLVTGSATLRRWLGPALGGAAAVGSSEAGYATTLLLRVEDPEDDVFAGLYLGRAAAWVLLSAAVVLLTTWQWRRRTAISQLVRSLEQASPSLGLQSSLRRVTGDDRLEVHYPVGTSGRRVGAAGSPAPRPPGDRTCTVLRRGQTTVAELWHDPHLLSAQTLQEALGPASRLALENERLTAEQLARLHDVRASRARIVETGDAARRQIERDLHDGAQQRLLALSHAVRLACDAAAADGAADVVALLDAAQDQSRRALHDLRALAHGIHPAPLSEAGLAVALRSLADTAPVPVDLVEVTRSRYAPSLELAAHAVVRAAVTRAPCLLSVRVLEMHRTLVVEVDGCTPPVPDEVADRVGALGGRTACTTGGWRAELPCG